MTQSSSVLSPFDPFMAIDRSYATCYRSEKVRKMKWNKIKETKRKVGGLDPDTVLRITRSVAQITRPRGTITVVSNIRFLNMNTNGWSAACDGGGGKTCG